MHTIDRQREQLSLVGITDVELPDLSFLPDIDPGNFGLPDRFALLAPGGAPHRPDKRWPPEHFATIANRIAEGGTIPVILGTEAEAAAAAVIEEACPAAISLLGKTSLLDVVPLARRAAFAVGNDTGPMHLVAAANCPSTVLFSDASDPALCGPRGAEVQILRRGILSDLSPEEILATLPTLRTP